MYISMKITRAPLQVLLYFIPLYYKRKDRASETSFLDSYTISYEF